MVWDESKDRDDLRNMIIILIVIIIVVGYLIAHFGPPLIEYFNSTMPATNTSNNTFMPD
jgi:cytochrome b561